jgi:succinoglycan biosynthesis protein ExoM
MPVLTLVVGVLTYRRADQLCTGLSVILAQVSILNADGRGISARVLVVDNDPAGSARSAVASLADDRVKYAHEPVPGISAGRNRALDEASDADLLAFIDDDETPRPGWLTALVDTWLSTRPTAVMGRVFFNVPADADPWVVAGGFFVRPRRPTGAEIAVAGAGNLLLDLRQVRALGLRFDPRLGLSGGEDTLFSRQLVRRGGRIVWCDESVADDYVPAKRATRQWVLQRAWRVGNCTALADLYLAENVAERCVSRVRYALRGLARIAGGALRYAVGRLVGSDRHEARGLRTVRRGQGMLSGARGTRFDEYARSVPLGG